MPSNITFRTQLLGGVTEFCHNSRLSILINPIHFVELIVLLARYQEEGAKLCPKVYLTNDIEQLTNMLPGGEKLKIGITTCDIEGIKRALKKCAPLASGGWCIYINSAIQEIEFGVFRGPNNPISVLVDDVVMTPDNNLNVVTAFQVADDCVEIKSNNGAYHYIFLNHRKEDSPPPLQFLNELVEAITAQVDADVKESTESFLRRLLFESLRQSHGCIIAVTNMGRPPRILADDGIILDSPIDFSKLIRSVKKEDSTRANLESKAYLLKGMLNCDGIILFDSRAKLLGFNCFVKINSKVNIVGGARKRAFSALTAKLEKGLSAVFMQSQDGWSEFRGMQ